MYTRRLEYVTFYDFKVEYAGAFFINDNNDLVLNCVQISKITTTGYYIYKGEKFGCAAFLYIGNNFYGSRVCGSELESTSNLIAHTDISLESNNVLNSSSFHDTFCEFCSVSLNHGYIISNDINASHLVVNNDISTLHFGGRPYTYKHSFFIGCNNTGRTIYGHSSGNAEIQTSKYVVLIDNTPKDGLLKNYGYNHRFFESYFKGNKMNNIIFQDPTYTITFENCYNEGTTGITEKNPKTFYETNVLLFPSQCFKENQKYIFQSISRITGIKTRKYHYFTSHHLLFIANLLAS